ncbi:MAG TPA: methyltransferase [Pseudonocardiaceae bacterium]|nr:methyltransferase [Pseudonocardiaceae bacterium]
MDTELDPSHIMQVAGGFWASKTLLSAVELHLFTQLGGDALTGEQIGERIGLHLRAIDDFLDALVALGFLAREGNGPDGRYRNTAETAMFLDKRSPAYIGGLLEMLSVRGYRHWSDLTEALRTGQAQNETKYTGKPLFEELSGDPAKLEQFMIAMAAVQLANFRALAEKFDFTRYRTLCDAGGATGQLCTIIGARNSNLRCTSFDLPIVTPIAEKAIAAAGLDGRVGTASGDFFTDSLPRAESATSPAGAGRWASGRLRCFR